MLFLSPARAVVGVAPGVVHAQTLGGTIVVFAACSNPVCKIDERPFNNCVATTTLLQ